MNNNQERDGWDFRMRYGLHSPWDWFGLIFASLFAMALFYHIMVIIIFYVTYWFFGDGILLPNALPYERSLWEGFRPI